MCRRGKTEVLGDKTVPLLLGPPQISRGLVRNRTVTSVVFDGMDILQTEINLNDTIPSPYRAVNTLRLSYKNQSVNVV